MLEKTKDFDTCFTHNVGGVYVYPSLKCDKVKAYYPVYYLSGEMDNNCIVSDDTIKNQIINIVDFVLYHSCGGSIVVEMHCNIYKKSMFKHNDNLSICTPDVLPFSFKKSKFKDIPELVFNIYKLISLIYPYNLINWGELSNCQELKEIYKKYNKKGV